MTTRVVSFDVNGRRLDVAVEPHRLLADVIREAFAVSAVEKVCADGLCGACTVLVAGEPVCACLMLAIVVDGRPILTVEGLAPADGTANPLLAAFAKHEAARCGHCAAGMLMSATALLDANPRPTREDAERALSGNICGCAGEEKIVDAVLDAASQFERAREIHA